jgi:hypothetical protein
MDKQELRPMGIGDILDATFRLYRQRFVAFMAIALVCYVPFALFTSVISILLPAPAPAVSQAKDSVERNPFAPPSTPWNKAAPQIHPAALIGIVLFALLIMPLCSAAMIHNISATYLGENLSATASYGRAAPRLLPLLGTNFLVMLAIFVGYLMCFVPGVIFSLWFMLAAPVVILESISGPDAMRRSRELIRGNVGKGFVLLLVVWLLSVIISLALNAVVAIIPWPHPFFALFTQNVVAALVLPIQMAPLILLYYDLRIRKEAFDLERLASSLGEPAAT